MRVNGPRPLLCSASCVNISSLIFVTRYTYSRRVDARSRRADVDAAKDSVLTLSTPAVPNCCCSKGPVPYWSNPPFLIFDIRALWRSGLSARAPECQKLKMVGYASMAKCKALTGSAVKGLRGALITQRRVRRLTDTNADYWSTRTVCCEGIKYEAGCR